MSKRPLKKKVSVAKRKTVVRKLPRPKLNYRQLIDQASDAIFVFDNKGDYIDVNIAASTMLGYSRIEWLTMNVSDLLSDKDKEKPLQFDELLKGVSVFNTRDLKRKDGTLVPVETHVKMMADNMILGVARDISERRAAQIRLEELNAELEERVSDRTYELERNLEALKESEEKFQKVFQASAAGIAITDISNASYVDVNGAFAKLTGYAKEELIGRNSVELGLIADIEQRDEILKMLREQGSAKNFELSVRSRSGATFNFIASMETITLKGKKFAINVVIDITARKQAERQLEALNKELEAFSYSVSHDLRAPIRAISGFTNILEDDLHANNMDGVNYAIGVIRQSTEKMNLLIDNLIEFSRLGNKELIKAPLDMPAIVHGVLNEITQNQPHRAQVEVKTLLPARGDVALVTQVWTNLLTNAIKYSSKRESPKIEVGSVRKDSEVIYYVRDNGVGFDMNHAAKLFHVFQRLHNESDFKGTGIGLSIVQRIIDRHQGRVWAESVLNSGATFYFTLP